MRYEPQSGVAPSATPHTLVAGDSLDVDEPVTNIPAGATLLQAARTYRRLDGTLVKTYVVTTTPGGNGRIIPAVGTVPPRVRIVDAPANTRDFLTSGQPSEDLVFDDCVWVLHEGESIARVRTTRKALATVIPDVTSDATLVDGSGAVLHHAALTVPASPTVGTPATLTSVGETVDDQVISSGLTRVYSSLDTSIATVDASTGVVAYLQALAVTLRVTITQGGVTVHDDVTVTPAAADTSAAALATLIAALGGDANVLAIGTAASGAADARGAGHPAITVTGTAPALVGSGAAARRRFTGSNGYTVALGRTLTSDVTLVWLGTTLSAAGRPMQFGDPAAPVLALSLDPNGARPNSHGLAGMVVGLGSGTETAIQDGPGDRVQSPRVGLHTVGRVGTTIKHWSPPTPPVTATVSAAGAGTGDVTIGAGTTVDCALWAVLAAPLTTANRDALGVYARGAAAAPNVLSDRILVIDGDSIASGVTLPDVSRNYPTQLVASGPTAAHWAGYDDVNCGRASMGIEALITNAAAVDALYDASRAENLLVVNIGSNDFAAVANNYDAPTLMGRVHTYLAARRAVGWKVLWLPPFDRDGIFFGGGSVTPAVFRARKAAFLTSYDSDRTTYADYSLTSAQVATLGDLYADGAADNGARFYWNNDRTHPVALGYARIAETVDALRFGTTISTLGDADDYPAFGAANRRIAYRTDLHAGKAFKAAATSGDGTVSPQALGGTLALPLSFGDTVTSGSRPVSMDAPARTTGNDASSFEHGCIAVDFAGAGDEAIWTGTGWSLLIDALFDASDIASTGNRTLIGKTSTSALTFTFYIKNGLLWFELYYANGASLTVQTTAALTPGQYGLAVLYDHTQAPANRVVLATTAGVLATTTTVSGVPGSSPVSTGVGTTLRFGALPFNRATVGGFGSVAVDAVALSAANAATVLGQMLALDGWV